MFELVRYNHRVGDFVKQSKELKGDKPDCEFPMGVDMEL